MLRTAMAMAACLLMTCGTVAGAGPGKGSPASSSLTLKSPANSVPKVAVCHRAGGGWVPLRLFEAGVARHVGKHGDLVYDASAGQCCTDADCAAGLTCTHAVGPDGESVIGTCPIAGGGTTDPRRLLLTMGLFGAGYGSLATMPGFLIRDATNQYFLSFTLDGIASRVSLANFEPSDGTILEENSPTPVTVTFPPRNAGLISYDAPDQRSYMNLDFSVTEDSLLGTGTVDLINAVVANFSLDITPGNPDAYPVVFTDAGEAYSILGIRGVYVQPTSYMGEGNGPAGFYMNLLNGSVISHVLVFREAVYDVQL